MVANVRAGCQCADVTASLRRPSGAAWDEDGVGPITNDSVLLADGTAACVSPPFTDLVSA